MLTAGGGFFSVTECPFFKEGRNPTILQANSWVSFLPC